MKHFHKKFSMRWLVVMVALVAMAFVVQPVSVMAQGDYEYEPGEGLHEEEWYDPSDWFDVDDDIDYEYDWYDYTYNYPYVYDYDYDYDYYDLYEDDWGYEEDFRGYDDEVELEYEYDYYTDDWYLDEVEFEEWYE